MFETDAATQMGLYFGQGWIFFMVFLSVLYFKKRSKGSEEYARFRSVARLTCLLLMISMITIMSVKMNFPNVEVPLYLSLPVPFSFIGVSYLILLSYAGKPLPNPKEKKGND